MKQIKFALAGIAFTAIGAGLGYSLRPEVDTAVGEPAGERAGSMELKKARARIGELEALLVAEKEERENARLAAESERTEAAVSEEIKISGQDEARKEVVIDPAKGDLNEQLKSKLTSEEYGAVSNALARMRAQRVDRDRGKIAFLESIDVSGMNADDAETHRRYIDLLSRYQKVTSKYAPGVFDKKSLTEQIELQMQMKPLAERERTILLDQMAAELGYGAEDSALIRDTVADIYDATSGGSGLGGIIGGAVSQMVTDGSASGVSVNGSKLGVATEVVVDVEDAGAVVVPGSAKEAVDAMIPNGGK